MRTIGQKLLVLLKLLDKACRYTLLFIIKGIRPFLGPAHCKYHVGCTTYAEKQLKNKYFIPAIWIITKRVLSCNPFMDPKESLQ